MELTEQQQHDVAYEIAADNPHILIRALRANGFYLYSIHKTDLQYELEQDPHKYRCITEPITDDDMKDINSRVRIDDILSTHYGDMIEAMLHQINNNRADKDFNG